MNEDDRVELMAKALYDTFNTARLTEHPEDKADYEHHAANLERWLNIHGLAITALQGADTVTEAMIEAEIALCKEAVRHCMNGSGLQRIGDDVWHQFAKARLKLRAAAPTAQDDTGARLDAVWDELQSLLPQSGVGAELQSAWDRLRSLLAAQSVGGTSAGR